MANMFVTKFIKHIVTCMMWMFDQLIVYSYDLSWEIYKNRTRYQSNCGMPLTRELPNYTSLIHIGNRQYKQHTFNKHCWNQDKNRWYIPYMYHTLNIINKLNNNIYITNIIHYNMHFMWHYAQISCMIAVL